MKALFSVWILVLAGTCCMAQGKFDANWCFGFHAGLHFDDTTVTRFYTNNNDLFGTQCISDSSGNIIFYTSRAGKDRLAYNDCYYNYLFFYDLHNNRLFPNDSTPNTAYLATPSTCIKMDSTYVYASIGFDEVTGSRSAEYLYLTYLNLNSGQLVLQKNVTALHTPLQRKMDAVRHANGKDWWLLLHASTHNDSLPPTNTFYRFLITQDSVLGPYTQDIGSLNHNEFSDFGELHFNPDGSKLLYCSAYDKLVELYKFDRCTGLLEKPSPLTFLSFTPFNAEFYNKHVFITSAFQTGFNVQNSIYQLTIDSLDLLTNPIRIYNDTTGYNQPDSIPLSGIGGIRLAQNNKIYI